MRTSNLLSGRNRWLRLFAQGAGRRPIRAAARPPRDVARRVGHRFAARRSVGRPAPSRGALAARGAHGPRTRRAATDGRGPLQRRHRGGALPLRIVDREAHQRDLFEARAVGGAAAAPSRGRGRDIPPGAPRWAGCTVVMWAGPRRPQSPSTPSYALIPRGLPAVGSFNRNQRDSRVGTRRSESCRARQCPLLCRLDLLGQREGQPKCVRIGRDWWQGQLSLAGSRPPGEVGFISDLAGGVVQSKFALHSLHAGSGGIERQDLGC